MLTASPLFNMHRCFRT